MKMVIELVFTRDDASTLEHACLLSGRTLELYTKLSDHEAYAVLSHQNSWPGEDIRVPASHHEKRDLVDSASDQEHSGRPVTLHTFTSPKDSDALVVTERGGRWGLPIGAVETATLTRSAVFHPCFEMRSGNSQLALPRLHPVVILWYLLPRGNIRVVADTILV
jgi:hypothetical protein